VSVALVDPLQLVGASEAAAIVGITVNALKLARKRGAAPEPIKTLACGPIWTRDQIEEWAAEKAARRP